MFNRKKAESKRRVHLRHCDTCKDMANWVVQQKVLAQAGKAVR